MDPIIKKQALKEAIKLTEVALASNPVQDSNILRDDCAANFVEAMYKKLCDLHEDAMTD